MENRMDFSPEELEKMLEKAKRDAQALLDKMTPEERAQAERRTQELINEDQASMQKMIEDARKVAAGFPAKENAAPRFCPNCGAAAAGGKFCEYCGSQLQ